MEETRLRVLEKEIDLVQACIQRMAQNSFVVRGWAITLITFALALVSKTVDLPLICGVLLVVAICFWYLDAFFLRLERLYRWKYEWIIANRQSSAEFMFDLNPYCENTRPLNEDGSKRKTPSIVAVMFTKTLLPIYGVLMLLLSAFIAYSLVF